MMGKLRELLADDVEVYEFALSRSTNSGPSPSKRAETERVLRRNACLDR